MENRQTNLDFFRGMAALVVAAGHLRAFVFSVPSPILQPSPLEKVFFFLTQFPNEAVTVFFVLSGYFIGGSVIKSVSEGKWSWTLYASRRLTRLWTVLFPALVLTFILDSIGGAIGDPKYYHGARDGLIYFLGNLFFLQTICIRGYGSNGPLWSLAYEFWYYLLFPLLYLTIVSKNQWWFKISGILGIAFLLFLFPGTLIAGGLVWLMGVMAFLCAMKPNLLRITGTHLFFAISTVFFLASLYFRLNPAAFRSPSYAVGITFAGMIPFLSTRNWNLNWYQKVTRILSEISYTLYLVHFPVFAFAFFGLELPYQHPPSPSGWYLYGGLLAFVLIFSRIWWFLFEHRTTQIREFCERVLIPRARGLIK